MVISKGLRVPAPLKLLAGSWSNPRTRGRSIGINSSLVFHWGAPTLIRSIFILWGLAKCTFENTSSKKKQLDRLFLTILFQLPADFPVSPVRLLLLGGEVARALAHPPSHLIFHPAPTVWQFCAALSTFRGVTSHGHTTLGTPSNVKLFVGVTWWLISLQIC